MIRRTKRSLDPGAARQMLADLEDGWQRTVQWMARVPVGSPAYVALDALCGIQVVAIKAARHAAEPMDSGINDG